MKPLLRRLLLWVALPVLLVALAVWNWTPREPSWDGRSLSEWLKDFEGVRTHYPDAADEQLAAAARRAIQGMGTNCLPFLLRRIEQLEPTRLEVMWIELEELLGKKEIKLPWTSTEDRIRDVAYNALYGVEALGHQAAPAVPDFQRWLLSNSAGLARIAAQLLASIPPEGVAVLISASTNLAVSRRDYVAGALHWITSDQPPALTALLGMAADPDPYVRAQVGYLIADSRYEAIVIWPGVKRLLADPENYVRRAAMRGLDSFKGDLRPATPALTALLADPDPEISSQANALLLKIKAQSATPPPAP